MNKPRWRSLKLGDSVITKGGDVLTLVAERRRKQRWSEYYVTYWRLGQLLNLMTGQTYWEDLDDCRVLGEIVRVPR